MSKLMDLTGQRFGRLVVIERSENDEIGRARWKCVCDCNGKEVISDGKSLRSGKKLSCGCLQKEQLIERNKQGFVDLLNKTFGRLYVVEHLGINKFGQHTWLCECNCENKTEIILDSSKLTSGNTQSCGCYKKDKMRKSDSSFNKLYSTYKHNAKSRGLHFGLNKMVFEKLVQGNCHYCGVKPSKPLKNFYGVVDYFYNGIDRVDNKIGYVPENCVSCCETCNRAKRIMGQQEFYSWIDSVYHHIHRNDNLFNPEESNIQVSLPVYEELEVQYQLA
jgi:hypothetical protein